MGSERRCYGFVAIVNWCIRKSWKLGDILTHLGSIRSDGAWKIPGMAEPGGLPSMGSHRVRHD